jgi:adenine-specific DNA-methyltransferase
MSQGGEHEEEDGAELELSSPPVDASPGARQAPLPLQKPVLEFGRPLDAPRRRRSSAPASAPVDEDRVGDYRHPEASRTNIPEAGLATQDRSVPEKVTHSYDPHLDPQLVWAGKAEHESFEVDSVSLHIHERVSTAAVLRAVRREDVQRTLFSEPQFSLDQELAFYQHEMDWANRLILGDSLLVMNSLLRREGMAGAVQCIYIDPPYGVNYNSNFQPRVDQRDVKDDDRSLTREPEQIRAYRDTWQLGIHSYLTYLRDRLLLARGLLAESGSVFVQIGDENLHHVREVMDEVFGSKNHIATISFRKTAGFPGRLLGKVYDYLIWYARDISLTKYHQLYRPRTREMLEGAYSWLEEPDETVRRLRSGDFVDGALSVTGRRFQSAILVSSGASDVGSRPYVFAGIEYKPSAGTHWKTTKDGLDRLAAAGRLMPVGRTLTYKRYEDDFPVVAYQNSWDDTLQSTFSIEKIYVVQTPTTVVARCVLMTTDPGDLVLDPTCGSGTTAYVAEQWGRRWITCDTSRVALALARQRLMTANYDYYQVADSDRGVDGGFRYKTVPHVTLKSIAQDEPPETETLYDQPTRDRSKTRVSGPFTVEQIPSFGIDEADGLYEPGMLGEDDRSDDIRHRGETDPVRSIGELVDLLRVDGVRLPGGRKLDFIGLAPTGRIPAVVATRAAMGLTRGVYRAAGRGSPSRGSCGVER